MTVKRKSKFNLDNPAFLKIPRDMFHKLKKLTPKDMHWSEHAREMLEQHLSILEAV